MKTDLRPNQLEAMRRLRDSIGRGNRRPVLMAPTGYGKTMVGAAVVDGALSKGKRIVFVVPALSLINQTVEAFAREGISEVGVIQADHPLTDWSKPVQVASVQTLARRRRPEADVVVVDECHLQFDSMRKWMAEPEWQKVPFIGLSATPWAKGMGQTWDDLIIVETTERLIEQGYLSPFRVFAPAHPDLDGVKITAGDYNEKDLAEVMADGGLVAGVVETWLDKGEDRPTLCFAVDRAHAKKLADQFERAGVPTGYQDAYTDDYDRREIVRKFRDGEIKVVCNVGTLTTGVDWDVRCIILARPTRSEILHVQIIGRGLRTADGKTECLILDHSDNHLRLGFVTDIKHDTLDDGKRGDRKKPERKDRLPKECPTCSFLKPIGTRVCPACGFQPEVKSGIEEHDGELVEITRGAKKREYTMAEKQAWLSGLIRLGAGRGYKPGWALNKYREKFGVWPDHSLKTVWGETTPEMIRWVQSRQIAWANSKRRKEADGTSAAMS